jgi:stringent starvation protein B
MTSNRPYLIRALYQWIIDNGLTPHLLVLVSGPEVRVPPGHVQAGQIVLNLAPTAVRGLTIGNERIEFSARFGGAPFPVSVPPQAVRAVYARENGQGMVFPDEDGLEPPEPPPDTPPRSERPGLKLVK